MSDIRLKKITIESGPLIIQNGQVVINNTTVSTNVISSALLVNGGISINCTSDSVSSTSGGAISIGGGLAVSKQTFLGNNLTLENNNSTFIVNGITNNRLFLDTVNNKSFTISPDGITNRFLLSDINLLLNYTRPSTNSSTASLVVNGGISINCSVNSTNSSVGGALTVNGGTSIAGDVLLSKSLVLGETFSGNTGLTVRYIGSSGSQISLNNSAGNKSSSLNMNGDILMVLNNSDINFKISSGNFVFSNYTTASLLTITSNNSIFSKSVFINDTTESLNNSTASLLTNGGITINCTTDANASSGGGITIMGGINVNKKAFFGDNITVQPSSNKNNKLVLYQQNADLSQSYYFTGLGNSGGSLNFELQSQNNDYIFNSCNTSGSNNTEVFRIKGTNEVQFFGNTQKYSVLGGGISSNDLTLRSNSVSTPLSLNLISTDSDKNDNVDLKIVGYKSSSGNEYLKIGWSTNTGGNSYVINTNKSGDGNSTPIILQTNSNNDQLKLYTDGTVGLSSTQTSQNYTTASLLLMGGMSINNTNDAVNISVGSALTVAGGMSVSKSLFVNNINIVSSTSGNINISARNNGDLLLQNNSDNFVFCGNNTGANYYNSLQLYSLNNQKSNNYELVSLSLSGSGSIFTLNSNNGGSGILHPMQINTGNNVGIYLHTSGNIGINTTNPSPSYALDISGALNTNGFSNFNTLKINNTTDSTNQFSSGSLSVGGGVSISKSLFVGGKVTLFDTTNSNSSTASLLMYGGMTILNTQNGTIGSGSLTLLGGAFIQKDVYIGQNLYTMGLINANSSIFDNVRLTSTNGSVNLNTGSLITNGGITINCSQNSVNISNGGSILSSGGASIGKDVYIGGNLYNYGVNNYYGSVNSLINLYDSSNILRFSIDKNVSSNDFSISRYDSSSSFIERSINISSINGVITLNNSVSSTSTNSASLILMGGLTVNSTSNSTSLGNGGSVTVMGGASISKNVYIGGDVVCNSTTVSSNCSTGSLVVAGGLGVSGNLNILGNTIMTGNLTVMGTTTSIQSTTTLLNDNVFLLNSGPTGSKDSGILVQRYQNSNDSGSGDVVSDNPYILETLPNQSGMSSTQFKFNTFDSSIDNYYTGWYIKITSGFSNNQVRKITNYVGSTRIATIETTWTTQNPSNGDSFSLYNKPYVGMIYDELHDRFNFGSTALDPVNNVVFTDYLPIYFSSASSTSTQNSTNASTGGLLVSGGVAISNTNDSVNSSNGSALTVAGGASIAKTLHVGNSVYIGDVNITPNIGDISTTIFNASNNVSSASDITGLNFNTNVWGFDIYLVARLTATSNAYSNYHISGVNKGTSWEIVKTYVGDSIAEFYITNTGQIQYTTNNFSGFSSLIFKFKAYTN